MVKFGAAAYRAEGQAVDLLVCLERIAGELDSDIAQDAGIVGLIVPTVLGARSSLDDHFALVVARLSAEDDSAPVSRLPGTRRLL